MFWNGRRKQHNIVWGYDAGVNGPMLPWAISVLRHAAAEELAERVEREDFDSKVQQATVVAHEATIPGTDMLDEAHVWMSRWKALHPQFNIVGQDEE